jgi:hypothetical protein
MSDLVNARTTWHAPTFLEVEKSQRIGLEVGQSESLRSSIEALLPGTASTPGGTIAVGTSARARLIASADDAEITPSDAVNSSTDFDIALLWTWTVRPKRPVDHLVLTAHIEVPLEGSTDVVSTDVPLQIPVHRTASYTLGQIFTSWQTWSALAASAAGGGVWIFGRVRNRKGSGRGQLPQPFAADIEEDIAGASADPDSASVTAKGHGSADAKTSNSPIKKTWPTL